MIDLGAIGAILNDSSTRAQNTNATLLSNVLSSMSAGETLDTTITWIGDLYTNQTIIPPQVHVNGTNNLYFGIAGQQPTRLIYTGTSWALDCTWGLAAQSPNDLYARFALEYLTVWSPNGSGVRISGGGKSVAIRSLFIAYCAQYGGWFEYMDGSFFDDLQANGCMSDGLTFQHCHQVTLNRIESNNNGRDGVSIFDCGAMMGTIDTEGNGRYGLNADSLVRSNLTIWQEANRMLETKNSSSGLQGQLGRNPFSPSGAIYPIGNTGEILPQGRLVNSSRNIFSGQYGQDSNSDFDTDPLSRHLCLFHDDWRSYVVDQTPWTNICANANLSANGWTSDKLTVTNNDGGTGINTITIKTNAFASGTPPNANLEIKTQDSHYPGESGGGSFTWSSRDTFAIDMTIEADTGTYSYLWTQRTTNLLDVETINVIPLSGIGLDSISQYWYLPATLTSGPNRFRTIANSTLSGVAHTLRFFVLPLRFLASGPTQQLTLTISNINIYYLPANKFFGAG